MNADVIITGGGLGGAVLAALLGRQGKRVLVLEKSAKVSVIPRPEILWPASVALLRSVVSAARLEAEGLLPLRGIDWLERGKTHRLIGESAMEQAGVRPMSTDPTATRALALASADFTLRHGVEVVGLLREGQQVRGVRARDVVSGQEEELTATWTIGDDGARSVVRQELGIGLETRLFPVEFLVFSFTWPAAWEPGVVRIFRAPAKGCPSLAIVAAAPLPQGRGAGIVGVLGQKYAIEATPVEEWAVMLAAQPELSAIVSGLTFPRDFTHVKRPYGHAASYGAPGCALLGDAIHPVSPAGGQGTNMSLMDARALAEIIIESPPDALARYERLRRPANERSLAITERAAGLVTATTRLPGGTLVGGSLPKLLAVMPWLAAKVLGMAASAFDDER